MSTAYRWVEAPWPMTELPREQLEDRIQQLLGSTNMCVMATTGKNGPIASPIEYYADCLDLYMLPDPGTPKLKALQRDSRISVAVHGAYHGWHSARGAQLFGRAEIIEPHAPGKLLVHFARPQRALTPGQVCAFYDGGRVLGAAVFEEVL